jgi:cephalosporin hydroxylase
MDMRIWQQPNQLAAFLSWIYEHKKEINNYTEIGTAYGGTFYVIDSYLRAVNPNFTYSTGVDCMPRLVDFHFYQDKFPETEIVQSLSLDYAPVGTIDLCFIDTVHTYEYTMAEYEYYKKFCKYIAFHDIEGFPAMQRFWKEIKGKHQSWEFTQQYNNRVSMGIGVIKV